MSFLKSIQDKYKTLAYNRSDSPLPHDEDEDHEGEEPSEEDEPEDDDIYISSTGHLGSKTALSAGGKHIGTYTEDEDVQKAIVDWINKNKWYPNIWQVSDHGNYHRYTLDDKFQKMVKV